MANKKIIIIIVAVIVVAAVIALIVGLALRNRNTTPASTTPSGTSGSTTNGSTTTYPNKFNQFAPWGCFSDVLTPVNVNADGNIQCLSNDGKNCAWQSDLNTCNNAAGVMNKVPPGNTNPTVCTIDQYNNPQHWCNLSGKHFTPAGTPPSGTPTFPNKFSQYKPWICFQDVFTPVSVNADGNIQCLSNDGQNCVWETTKSTCDAAATVMNKVPPGNTKPAVCTQDQYTNPKHWCYLSGKYFNSA